MSYYFERLRHASGPLGLGMPFSPPAIGATTGFQYNPPQTYPVNALQFSPSQQAHNDFQAGYAAGAHHAPQRAQHSQAWLVGYRAGAQASQYR